MAKVQPPKLDPRDEDEAVADAISDLPATLTDRNNSAVAVKLIEACGSFYGALLYYLNQIPERLYQTLLNLVGVERKDATQATVTLEFTAASGQSPTIDAGTVVKTGTDADAVAFETDADVTLPTGGTNTVTATASEAGASGNVAAGELTELEQPLSGVDSVTNNAAASGGQDEEPIDELIDRAAAEFRKKDSVITGEDFTTEATAEEGVERALPLVDQGTGAITVHIVADDLNESSNSTLQSDVTTRLEDNTIPGTVITVAQKSLRIFQVTDIEIEYESGADTSTTDDRIKTALSEYLTAIDLFDADGTKKADGWEWGARLHEHEIISLVDQVDGVKRVGVVKYKTSDDYGQSWSAEQTLSGSIDPGWDGSDDTTKGLFDWGGTDYTGHGGFSTTAL